MFCFKTEIEQTNDLFTIFCRAKNTSTEVSFLQSYTNMAFVKLTKRAAEKESHAKDFSNY